MSKLVRRFQLGQLWEYGKNESWFSNMALKGMHLQNVGNFLVTFEKGEPKNTKYRIEILEENPSKEQLDVYKEYGWVLVANKRFFYIFSSPEELDAPELHTDPMEQSFTLKMIDKHLEQNMKSISIIFLPLLASLIYNLFLQDEPYLFLIERNTFTLIMLVLPYMYVFIESIRGYFKVKKIKDLLLLGIPMNHNKNWRLSYLFSSVFFVLLIAAIITALFSPYYTSAQRGLYRYKPLEEIPVISINSIETASVNDYWHKMQYDWSLLSPTQISISEDGYVDGEINDDSRVDYSPTSIQTRYYELTFKGMAEGLLNDLINRYYREYKYEDELVEIENSRFDRLYIASGEEENLIFASFDNKVVYIKYTGNTDIKRIISLMEEKYEL